MRAYFFELTYHLLGHPQRLNLSISAVLGQIVQAAYLLVCVMFLALIPTRSRGIALSVIATLSTVGRRHHNAFLYVSGFFSVFLTASILVSQLNWSHLPLLYLVAMLMAGILSSLGLFMRQGGGPNALIPVLAAPVLATFLICMPQPKGFSLGLFVIATVCFGYILKGVLGDDPLLAMTKWQYRVALSFTLLAMALVYILICINVHNLATQLDELAIHWGVFVSAAQNLSLHLRPLYDVPLQYGLGPSLVTYAFCNLDGNCWHGLYWLLVSTYPIFLILLYRTYLAAYPQAQLSLRFLFALLAFAGPIIWNSSGPVHALITPSTGPLRFLPVLALLLLLLRGRINAAYALAAINIWWSFDAAVMSAMCLVAHESARLGFRLAILYAGGIVIGSTALGIAGLWGIWGQVPDPLVYLEYLFHMPGKLDPEFFGTVWVFFIALGVSVALVAAPQSREELRLSAAIASTTLATLLYFLSRSVSVNIDNLLPFIVLLTIRAAWLNRNRQSWLISCSATLSVVIAGVVLPNWSGSLRNGLSYNVDSIFVEDRRKESALVTRIDNVRFGVVTIMKDQAPTRMLEPRWGLIDSWGEWYPLPVTRQQLYTERSLGKMPDQRRAGCMVVYKDFASLVRGYATAYDIVSHHDVGQYVMYGLLRKGASLESGTDPCWKAM